MNLLIRNENMKIYKRKRTWVMGAVFFVFIVLQVINLQSSGSVTISENWQQQLKLQNLELEQEIKKPDALLMDIKQANEKMLLNDYYIQHNTPPVTNTWNFAMNQVANIVVAVSFFAIIIAGEIIAAEFASGTIKFLLTRRVSRTQIYIAKYVASILFGLALLALGFIVTLLLGGLMFGFNGLNAPYLFIQNQAVEQASMLQALLGTYVLHIPYILLGITLAFMISATFRSVTFSIVISIFVAIAGFVISIAMNGWSWTKYFVFTHTDLSQFVYGSPSIDGITMAYSIVFVNLHLALLHLIAYPVFVKRDVM
ncbi:ABC-2 family transporter protein [compost metagenome]